MGIEWDDGGYSADVKIYLFTGGQKFAVSHMTCDKLILRDNAHIPNGHAQLLISIDGREELHDIILAVDQESSELAFA
jgi:hypothetical protein